MSCDHPIGIEWLPLSMSDRLVRASGERIGEYFRSFKFCPDCGASLTAAQPPKSYPAPNEEFAKRIRFHWLPTSTQRRQAVWWAYVQPGDHVICFWCGRSLSEAEFTVEHVIPKSRQGPHLILNLRPACWQCNQARADSVRDEEKAVKKDYKLWKRQAATMVKIQKSNT